MVMLLSLCFPLSPHLILISAVVIPSSAFLLIMTAFPMFRMFIFL